MKQVVNVLLCTHPKKTKHLW